jgi:LemA protein
LDQTVKTSWAQVENQLQRRFDLIPNLVETVKGYAKQEKDVMVEVTNARAKVGGAGNVPDKINANNELSGALSRLMVVVEKYPDLKSNQNFMHLQDELAGTENRIAVERMRYNEAVKIYNQTIKSFPANLLAGMFGFKEAAFFDAPKEAKEAVKVKF